MKKCISGRYRCQSPEIKAYGLLKNRSQAELSDTGVFLFSVTVLTLSFLSLFQRLEQGRVSILIF